MQISNVCIQENKSIKTHNVEAYFTIIIFWLISTVSNFWVRTLASKIFYTPALSQSAEEGYQKDLVPTRIWTADPWVMRPVW